MTPTRSSGSDDNGPASPTSVRGDPSSSTRGNTKAAAAWFATATALVLLVLLIILILQNQAVVEVKYFGFSGSIPLGTALLIAAVIGAGVVAIVGVVRLTQLRVGARRGRRLDAQRGEHPAG